MAKIFPNIPLLDVEEQDPVTMLVSEGTYEGVPPTTFGGVFALECLITDLNGSGLYQNVGTVAVPSWKKIGDGQTSPLPEGQIFIGNASGVATAQDVSGDVTIDKDGVTAVESLASIPFDVVVAKGAQFTTVGGAAAEDITITGVVATDLVFVQLVDDGTNNVSVKSAAAGAGKITVTFSADPGNDAVINYIIASPIVA